MDPVFLDNLRRMMVAQNIFGQSNAAPASVTQPSGDPTAPIAQQQVENPEPDFMPQQEIMDAYKQSLLKGQPQPEHHGTPYKLLAASLAGLANFHNPGNAFPAYQHLVEGNYNSDLAKWKEKVDALRLGASLENQTNVNTRQQQHQERQDKIANRNVDVKMADMERKAKAADADRAIAQQRADTASRRADIYAEMRKGGQVVEEKTTGKHYMVYKDGTKKDLDITGLTPEQLEEIKRDSTSQRIIEQGEQTRETEAAKHGYRTTEEAQKQAGREVIKDKEITGRVTVKQTPSGGKGGSASKELLPTQERVRIRNVAQQVRANRSDWAPFIKITGNDVVVADPKDPNRWFQFGGSKFPDAETRKQIVAAIWPEGEPKQAKTEAAPTKQAAPTGPPKNPKVGDTYTWPTGNTGTWDGKGWVVVRGS